MTLFEWIQTNIAFDEAPVIVAIMIGIIFTVAYDFYHLLFSAVLSWFKKG